jgi:rhamnosyltransferase
MAFYPGDKFESICRFIAENADFLLIVDNSPESTLLSANYNLPANTSIVYNKNNGAVAGALNIALELARTGKFEYLQLFDQDTVPPPGITAALVNTLVQNPAIVLVSPRFININTNFPGRLMMNYKKWRVKSIWPPNDIGLVSALFTITSASVINMKMLPDNFYYDERLIIDGCDVDFCLALRELGLEIAVDTSQCITHGIGNRKNGGGRWSPTNYSAQRKHLSAKNRVMVWRRYFNSYPGFVLNDIFVFTLDTARSVLLEKEKFKKFKAIFTGLISGARERDIKLRAHPRNLSLLIKKSIVQGTF